ncbi:MAG: carbon-nitrogen hydrolase family protein [Gammaproteobacteria bacterium]|nr:MAG: carbon-nitrogen hydrolase family protein [Gammaproteobacteria bacterium]
MTGRTISRRRFLECLVAGSCAALARLSPAAPPVRQLRACAIQMQPRLGDVAGNLAQAERLLDEAIHRGADWILLPEMFTSAAAFHEDMLRAIQPADGRPAQLLQDKARRHGVRIGGSFLASENGRVHNRFLLCLPDGSQHRHDKDQPTYWEACYYEDGQDDGVLHTTEGNIGVALCWEMIRARTAQRLRGRVELLLAGSTWWTLPDEADADHPYRHANRQMLREAPPRLARMLGVPVIHASHAGPFHGFDSPELPDVPYDSVYLGETMICDAQGKVLGQRTLSQGAGLVMADITRSLEPQPSEAIPSRFWVPEQMPEEWKDAWTRWLPRGKDYYDTVTRPYLASGEIDEYVPPYMRD